MDESNSTAGVTHEWDVETAYYSAKIPIWMDEIVDAEAWKAEFLKAEAKEVVEAVGAWIYCFRRPSNEAINEDVKGMMQTIQEVAEEHIGYTTDTVMLAVAVPDIRKDVSLDHVDHSDWEDLCIEHGFEYIDYAGKGMNEFREKTGFERLKEALEANEWAATGDDEDDLDLDRLDFENGNDFARDEAEMTAELFGMKAALMDIELEPDADDIMPQTDEAKEVDSLERLMGKLLAVKEQSADLPEAQRKRLAAQAVKELMEESKP